jgi:DNA-binding PadR family transcriptional regulator
MSLEHAILGLLDYEPMTGYDLKKMIDVSVAHFWPAVQSQIYKTLGRMAEAGWVNVEIISQEPRPPRKVYAITETGRTELFQWLETPQPAAETRLGWLIQIFFAGRLPDENVIVLLEHQLQIYRQRLGRFSAIPPENRDQMEEGSPRERFYWLLTVDYGVANALFQVRWLEAVLASIRKGEYQLPTLGS